MLLRPGCLPFRFWRRPQRAHEETPARAGHPPKRNDLMWFPNSWEVLYWIFFFIYNIGVGYTHSPRRLARNHREADEPPHPPNLLV